MKRLTAITAMDKNNAIGKDNKLLCKLYDDLHHFRLVTEGHIVVMGSKTCESIGRPLPYRINIILTRDENYPIPKCMNCFVMHSVEEVLDFFARQDEWDMFIIGGEQIYEQFLPYCNSLIVSHIQASFDDADAHFPQVNWEEWEPVGHPVGEEGFVPADERNEFPFSTVVYERITV
ncbi:dihydrofolate reductase [Paenibacillus alvei]|uniref:dihydrofolate reductase n=1 Tax=Paenibacillus alvei TaxID=44250 RepID=UPI0022813417|nr:dihydrofolate reductase [Paenibacillus alvei]MCY9757679.1 dihydrofolate reductase [Paenibacillus alvei]